MSEERELNRLAEQLRALPPEAWEAVTDGTPPVSRRIRWGSGWAAPRPALAGVLATAVFALGLVIGLAVNGGGGPDRGPAVALAPVSGAGVSGSAVARLAPGGRVTVTAHLPAPPAGTYYEAWLMTDVHHLVSLGSFRTGSHDDAVLSTALPAPAHAYHYIDISRQRVGAGPAHSGISVLRGPTAGLS